MTVDVRLDPAIRRALAERFTTVELPYGVTPALYACPNAVRDDGKGRPRGRRLRHVALGQGRRGRVRAEPVLK